MGKKYYFLAGLHRSGNTVLSAILNQHPDIYSSPLSPVSEYMWLIYNESKNTQYNDSQSCIKIISKIFDNYYEDIRKSIVFDREKNWAHPANIKIMQECLHFKPKIIFTTRSIIEILASFIALDVDTVVKWMNSARFKIDDTLTLNDNLCDYLMSEEAELSRMLNALKSIDNPDNAGMIHVVKYEDLLNTPQETMDKIYDFLEIESFKHNFKNIRKIEEYDEAAAGLPKDLHKVRRVLGRSDVRVEDYLTPRSIEKYKDVRYF